MKTEWLEAFHVTAETSSLTKASELLHMTQPALSKQIKNLEQAVGAPLFTRTTSGVSLTPAGEIVFKDGQRISNSLTICNEKLINCRDRRRLPSVHGRVSPCLICRNTSPTIQQWMDRN